MSDSTVSSSATGPVRVLHVLEATLGGTLRYMENIVDATAGLDIVSGFAYGTARADSRLNPLLARMTDMGWSTYPVDMRREIRPWHDLKAWFQLRSAVSHFAPHIIHCHSSKAGALGRTVVIGQRQPPARVYSPHALAAPLGSMYLTIEKLLASFTERFVAVSDTERREIASFALAQDQEISVVYPWVDSEHFRPSSRRSARKILGIGAAPLVLAIGRITDQKNPIAFLRVMEHIYAERTDVKAVWLGSGHGESTFLNEIRAAGMDHVVRIVPWQHDVRTYIAAADIVLSTSKFESFGYVTAEALAMHRPVVASDVTGTRDIMLNTLGGWLYPPERTDTAARLVLELLDASHLSAAVGELGRSEMKKQFSPERMRETLIEAYYAALNQPCAQLTNQPAVM